MISSTPTIVQITVSHLLPCGVYEGLYPSLSRLKRSGADLANRRLTGWTPGAGAAACAKWP
jgi:hypothetical protein